MLTRGLALCAVGISQGADVDDYLSLLQTKATVEQDDDGAVANGASHMKSRHDNSNKCLDYHYGNQNVYMHACHGGSNQKWYMADERLKTNYNDRCLDMDFNNNNVYMHACHSGSNQQWFYDGEQLKTRYDTSKCLDFHWGNNNIYMHACHGGGNQEFYYTHPANAARASKVKSKYSSKCMEIDNNDNIRFNTCNDQDNQKFYMDGWKLKSYFTDKCADYHFGNDNVYMHNCHSGKNQQWYFDGDYLKTNYNNKCLDLHTGNLNVYMHNCHSGSNQDFYLESVVQDLEHEEVAEEIEQEDIGERVCKDWCYSKKHKNEPWEGKKCAWKNCAGCPECP